MTSYAIALEPPAANARSIASSGPAMNPSTDIVTCQWTVLIDRPFSTKPR
jgi:hypothetical protein